MPCTRAQPFGGVLDMVKGTALFDTVAISDTEADRTAGRGCDPTRLPVMTHRAAGAGAVPPPPPPPPPAPPYFQ
jgi:hypothetical protein